VKWTIKQWQKSSQMNSRKTTTEKALGRMPAKAVHTHPGSFFFSLTKRRDRQGTTGEKCRYRAADRQHGEAE
jgi:hypothetical protein